MLRTRVIPTLLLRNESLVKTEQFEKFTYVGDPCNTVRIFNELEVDELLFLDINATRENSLPNLKVLTDIASECFMPLGYGGGIRTFEDAKKIFKIGFEKIVVNSFALEEPRFITQLKEYYGSQAVIAAIDVRRNYFGQYKIRYRSGKSESKRELVEWAQELEELGAGEILLTSIDREGTWKGFDVGLVKVITDVVNIPVIAHGGAGSLEHISEVVNRGGASAVALGSMVVFQKKGMGVLVNFPDRDELERVLC